MQVRGGERLSGSGDGPVVHSARSSHRAHTHPIPVMIRFARGLLIAAPLLSAACATSDTATLEESQNVLPGVEVLLRDSLHLLEGRRVHANTSLWIFTPRAIKEIATRNGYTQRIEAVATTGIARTKPGPEGSGRCSRGGVFHHAAGRERIACMEHRRRLAPGYSRPARARRTSSGSPRRR